MVAFPLEKKTVHGTPKLDNLAARTGKPEVSALPLEQPHCGSAKNPLKSTYLNGPRVEKLLTHKPEALDPDWQAKQSL